MRQKRPEVDPNIGVWRIPSGALNQIGEAVVATDAQDRVTYWNRSAERLYGLTARQILGRALAEAYCWVWPGPGEEQSASQALTQNGMWEGSAVHLAADGRELRVRSIVMLVKDEHGATSRLAFSHCEDALRIRGERLELLSEAAAHLLGARDPDVMVRELFEKVSAHLNVHAYFNYMIDDTGAALRLDSFAGIPERTARLIQRLDFGQAICGTVAQTRRMIHATDIQDSGDPKAELVRRYGIRAYCCHPLLAGDRLIGTLSFGSRAVDRFDDEEVEFMRTICHYVAIAKERLRLENDLRRRVRQLADADRRKDEFLAMLSHELRNPLAAVSSALDLLRAAGAQQGMLERSLDAAARQAGHMSHLLDDLLDVSRVTRGKITLKSQPVALGPVIEAAAEAVGPLMKSRGHTLTVDVWPEPMLVNGDSVRLTQVVSNLLNNAAKYTPPGGEIRLWAELEGRQGVIRVRDNGAGIGPDLLPCIFDLFVQADRSPDRSQGGLGIGLTLVRSLVEMHGGCVEAHSEGLGRGSEFAVRLPLAPNRPAETPAPRGEDKAGAPLKIMVVDDNIDAASMISALLELEGHDVTTAHAGPAAIQLATEQVPDVALLDIGMPEMDGFALAGRLRAFPELARTVLIAVTGYGRDEDFERSRAAGFDHHLVKPVEIQALRRVLRQVSASHPGPHTH